MNIAVINIKDLIKYACILLFLIIIITSVIIIIREKGEWKVQSTLKENSSSFLNYLKLQIPLMTNDDITVREGENKKKEYNFLGMELEIFENIKESEIIQIAGENQTEEQENIINEEERC